MGEKLECCSVCGKEVSKKAQACPHCGDPRFKGDPVFGCLGTVMKLIVLMGVLSACVILIFGLLQKSCSL